MLRKLRRASQYLSTQGDRIIRRDSAVSRAQGAGDQDGPAFKHPKASFLGLPAELRDQIYQYAASSTSLYLHPTRPRQRVPPVGLLLVCRQTWREYRFLLLAFATTVMQISGYDFSNAMRVLQSTDREALSRNTSLWVLLLMSHVPTRDQRNNLRTWCEFRAQSELVTNSTSQPQRHKMNAKSARLQFHYDFSCLSNMRPPRPPIRYANGYEMQLDLLRAHLRMIDLLRNTTEQGSSMKDELEIMYDDLLGLAGVLETYARPNG